MLETLNQIKNSLDTLVNGFYYMFHPIKGCKVLFLKGAGASYNIALVICFGSIFLYMCGSKKGRKLIPISITGYALIQAIASFMEV
ncbi:hypothetical protein [Clostridium haemolyticum]|uniref:Uncharacterized protein n=1 Tax=Clostridium haemolyticum NCTC 9693 TaxID=1443114 RepID=A0ABR4TH97_CLOHA|nr:hypothetical protein [Clostridium haemolyticum]KEI18235.1 hypothetical protein Z960_03670 [Clostridium haemolyticum NCTC 9693]KGN03866.1 hypothetical protein Z961_06065 [Clostridium haemolyticum NCTC 8350]